MSLNADALLPQASLTAQRVWAEERFSLALESAPHAAVMIDAQGRIVLVNSQTEKIFGYPRTELWGQPVEILVPLRFQARHGDYRQQFFADPAVRAMGSGRDLFGKRKDGSEFPVEIGLNPVPTGDGLLVLGAIVDITARKRAEEELRKTRAELENRVQERTMDLAKLAVNLRAQAELLDLAHDAIMVRRMDGRITFWNRGAEEVYGWTKSEAEGKQKQQLLRPEFPKPLAEIEADLLRDGRWEGILTHRRKDGTALVVSTHWALKYDEQGQPATVLEINNDITPRVRAEERAAAFAAELKRSNLDLAAVNKELEAFSYSVSHDLRAPLRAIDGFSRILLQQFAAALPDEAREYLQDVRANTLRMGQLVDDLLAFSRLGRQALKKEDVDTTRLVRQCIEELTPQKEGRVVDIQVGALPPSCADHALFKQVWINLLSNALKYAGKRPRVVIEIGSQVRAAGVAPVFFVKDNGVGFDMRYAHKLFGVFQRLHRAEDYEGTGVGLATVQRIIHRHGGKIWADAAPDRGATFFFTLAESEAPHD